MTDFSVDPANLTLQLTGLVTAEGNHVRQVLLDEIEARLPRDPEARVNIQLSELNAGRTASWHVHNGVVYFVVLRGLVSLQYEGRTEHYSAGDVYTEPIGVVHRPQSPSRDSRLADRVLGHRRRPSPHHRERRAALGSRDRPPPFAAIGQPGICFEKRRGGLRLEVRSSRRRRLAPTLTPSVAAARQTPETRRWAISKRP
jgi:quercetin dioxygenase-like cupin family protein